MHRNPRERISRSTLAALIIAAACATADTAIVAKPAVEFDLSLGQTASLSGTGYRITFDRVTDDVRRATGGGRTIAGR